MKKIFISAFVVSSLFLSLPVFSAELNLMVGNYSLVSKKRIGRTTLEYTYKLDILNNDTVLEAVNVTATLSSTSPKTTIVDGTVEVASIPASGNVISTDMFSIRQDRRFPFDPSSLNWVFAGIALPPDPGDAGKATLAGIDLDNDGVRDDIQRYIELTYPDSEKLREGLRQVAKTKQKEVIESDDKEKSLDNALQAARAIECLDYMFVGSVINSNEQDFLDIMNKRNALRAEIINTEQRLDAYLKFNNHLGGSSFRAPADVRKSACDFDPDIFQD